MMLNVLCLKHGTKYGPEYVNKLYNMVQRHLTIPYRFVCFTENSKGLDPKIEIFNLPNDPKISGWWWKPYLFKQGHFPDGDINLFFDLDMVIVSNIDKLINFAPEKFVGLEDVGRIFRRNPKRLGSAVMRWPANQYSDIWEKLKEDSTQLKKFQGDQDWIWKLHDRNIIFFPEIWIQSYKWEVRNRNELVRVGRNFVFRDIKHPVLNTETCVLAFHGTPNPEDVQDPIIVDNWR